MTVLRCFADYRPRHWLYQKQRAKLDEWFEFFTFASERFVDMIMNGENRCCIVLLVHGHELISKRYIRMSAILAVIDDLQPMEKKTFLAFLDEADELVEDMDVIVRCCVSECWGGALHKKVAECPDSESCTACGTRKYLLREFGVKPIDLDL